MKKIIIAIAMGLVGHGYLSAQTQDFQKVESKYFKNLYQVNDSLYRSEQPNRRGIKELEAAGIKSIITFRRKKDDTRKAKGTSLQLESIPLKASELTEAKITEVLRVIHEAPKPVLIHCWAGSDRTGVMTAAYRVIFENWPKEKAIEEMRFPDFGYHEKWYPNLVDLIRDMDVDKVKRELGIE